MVHSHKFSIILGLIMMLSVGLVMAASEQARQAGYHAPLYTNTIVDYDGTNAPIVISGGLISNGDISAIGNAELVFGHQPGLNVVGAEIAKVSTRYRYGSANVETPKISFINYNTAGTGWYTTSTRYSAGISLYTIHSNSQIEAIRINSQGNVGIGTTNPSHKLDVAGTGRFTGAILVGAPTAASHATTRQYVDDAISGLAGSIPAPSPNLWAESGTNIYRLNGNVGIGTSSPSSKLHVSGAVRATEYCIGTNCISNWGDDSIRLSPPSPNLRGFPDVEIQYITRETYETSDCMQIHGNCVSDGVYTYYPSKPVFDGSTCGISSRELMYLGEQVVNDLCDGRPSGSCTNNPQRITKYKRCLIVQDI